MFRSGAFVADHVTEVDPEQVQPNGVDLTVESILEPRDSGRIGRDDKAVAVRQEVPRAGGDPPTYYLRPGGYVVRYAEAVSIPEDHVGFLLPRSTLLRNACTLNTAVWDAGYEGRGEGLLQVHNDIEIETGARIGQLVLAAADAVEGYDGSYQGERI